MGRYKQPNYKRVSETRPCPICGAQIKLRGIGSHMRLVHPNASISIQSAPKQLSMLSEDPEPPNEKVVSNAPKNVKKAMDADASSLLLWGAAMYFLFRWAKIQSQHQNTLSEGKKLTRQRGKLMML